MKKVQIFVGAALATVFLVGCGGNAQTPERDTPGGDYSVGTVNFKGKEVDCIFWRSGYSNTSVGGMACDFAGARNGR